MSETVVSLAALVFPQHCACVRVRVCRRTCTRFLFVRVCVFGFTCFKFAEQLNEIRIREVAYTLFVMYVFVRFIKLF